MTAKLAAGGWLNGAQVRSLAQRPGKHAIGPKTLLVIRRPGKGYAEWRFTRDGKLRTLGLGGWPMPIAEIRANAEKAAALYRQGLDPVRERQAAQAGSVSFRQVAEQYITAHAPKWRSAKHAGQWAATLEAFAFPVLGDLSVAAVDTVAVLKVLNPIWIAKAVTAGRLRGRLEAVLDYAKAMGWRSGENPARWRGHLQLLLPATNKVHERGHYAALAWQSLPALMTRLRQQDGVSARALGFAILTVARSAEVRGARWSEIDLQAAVWTVPGARMKAGKQHRVPLSSAALDVLRQLEPLRRSPADFVFPGWVTGQPLASASLLAALRRAGCDDTVHGCRAAFSTWRAEATEFPRELAEIALAHAVGDATEQAYQRGDALDKRRELMTAWAAYCGSAT